MKKEMFKNLFEERVWRAHEREEISLSETFCLNTKKGEGSWFATMRVERRKLGEKEMKKSRWILWSEYPPEWVAIIGSFRVIFEKEWAPLPICSSQNCAPMSFNHFFLLNRRLNISSIYCWPIILKEDSTLSISSHNTAFSGRIACFHILSFNESLISSDSVGARRLWTCAGAECCFTRVFSESSTLPVPSGMTYRAVHVITGLSSMSRR